MVIGQNTAEHCNSVLCACVIVTRSPLSKYCCHTHTPWKSSKGSDHLKSFRSHPPLDLLTSLYSKIDFEKQWTLVPSGKCVETDNVFQPREKREWLERTSTAYTFQVNVGTDPKLFSWTWRKLFAFCKDEGFLVIFIIILSCFRLKKKS